MRKKIVERKIDFSKTKFVELCQKICPILNNIKTEFDFEKDYRIHSDKNIIVARCDLIKGKLYLTPDIVLDKENEIIPVNGNCEYLEDWDEGDSYNLSGEKALNHFEMQLSYLYEKYKELQRQQKMSKISDDFT